MPSPGTQIRVFDKSLYSPRTTRAVMGCVGPATKGKVNVLTDFTDEGTFVDAHGKPTDRSYAQRAVLRYLKRGNLMKFARIAGTNLATATATLSSAAGATILTLSASSAGTWANSKGITVAVLHNGVATYNIQVFQDGQLTEQFLNLTNGDVVSRITNGSNLITAVLAAGAGAVFPAATKNAVTNAVEQVSFAGGNDGAFASTDSVSSSTSGIAGKRFYGLQDAVAGSRTFAAIKTIDTALAGKTIYYGDLAMAVVPGAVTIAAEVTAGVFVEFCDDESLSLSGGGGGVGYLKSNAGTHVGFVDYRTGKFGIKLTAGSFFNTGAIKGIWIRAVTESVGTGTAGTGTYSGALSSGPAGVGYYTANKLVITVPISETVGASPTATAAAASSVATLKTLAGWVVPGTVKLTPAHASLAVPPAIYDDGFGGFRSAPNGGGAIVVGGAIDYRTGVWAVTTWDPVGAVAFPATAGTIAATYDIQVIDMGGGAVPGSGTFVNDSVICTSVTGTPAALGHGAAGCSVIPTPIMPGELRVSMTLATGAKTVYDNGSGGWLDRPRGDPRAAAVTGTVDYTNGQWALTPGSTFVAASMVKADYTSVPESQSKRGLRGTGPQYVANTTANAAGMDLTGPTAGNSYNGANHLDHATGKFSFTLDLVTTGANTFDIANNGTLTAVYAPADILGYGNGSTAAFTGTLKPAPFRRDANRLVAFQGANQSAGAAGDAQAAYNALGATAADDTWSDNVTSLTSPVDLRTGVTTITWTAAPALDEAVYVVAEEVVLHATSRYPGDIGNATATPANGVQVSVRTDPTLANTLQLRVLYKGAAIETFGQAPDAAALVTKVNAATGGSDYIRLESQSMAASIAVDTDAEQVSNMAGAFTSSDVVGAKVGNTYTGIQHFRDFDAVALDWLMAPGQWHSSVIVAMQELCELPGRRAIGILPTPETTDVSFVKTFVNGTYTASALVPNPPTTSIDSNALCVFAPWVQYLDSYTNLTVTEPPDGDIAMLVANTDSEAEPWFPIAGFRRGKLSVSAIKYSSSKDDRDLSYGPVGTVTQIINSIVSQPGRGVVLMGQRTAQRAATALDRINVRWTINVIMTRIDAVASEFLFELIDASLFREIDATLVSILEPIKQRRGLQDYYVVVDETTTTATDIDNLTVKAKVFLKPARAAEFLEFDIVITPTGADFADVTV